MKITIIEQHTGGTATIIEKKTVAVVAPFDTGFGKVPLSLFAGAGDMVAGTAAGAAGTVSAAGSANGDTLVYDDTLSPPWKTAPAGGAASTLLTNKDASQVVAGDVIVFDALHSRAFTTTTIQNDLRVLGVAAESIDVDDEGLVYIHPGSLVAIKCNTGAVAIGDFLGASTTRGQARSCGVIKSPGAFAIAMSSKAAGSAGTVYGLLCPQFITAVKGDRFYAAGGKTASAVSSAVGNIQKFTIANQTWSMVTATLPGERAFPGGIGRDTTAMYVLGGADVAGNVQGDIFKITYSSPEAISTLSGTTPIYSLKSGGSSSQGKGYVCGGFTTAATNAINKLTFASEAIAALGGTLSSSKVNVPMVSDGNTVYACSGGTDNGDKITAVSDTVAAWNDCSLGNTSQQHASMNIPSTAGYIGHKTSGVSHSHKITFSSGVRSDLGSSPSVNCGYGAGGGDGASLSFIGGGYDGSVYNCAPTTKLDASSDTYSPVSGGDMLSGKSGAACASVGVY